MPNLGPDWQRLPDGTAYRKAARVIALDHEGRVLLARGHDADQPERTWWFTIGGGIEAGEGARQAAVRELEEESGLVIAEADLIGPVLTREAEFDFFAETVRQDETFFLACADSGARLTTQGWTAVERGFMDEVAWWHAEDLAEVQVEVFPAELAELVRRWRDGWDGEVLRLGLRQEGEALRHPSAAAELPDGGTRAER